MNKPSAAPPGNLAPAATGEDLSSVFNYPALGRLFDAPEGLALAEMRQQLTRTNQDLERVIRQGSKEDAGRAHHIARAFQITLAFLDELEQLRQKSETPDSSSARP